MIGQTIDRYRVVEQLGQGGMGIVYKARDTVLERFVALKVLPPDRSSDPERRRRFLKEAKAASSLNHPGIVAVHDVLTIDDQDILVMELVEGETLEELLLRKRLPLGKALRLGIAITDALARAHAAGIVHRDLKPSNVMVTPEGVKLLDFGLAKQIETTFVDPEGPTLAPGESDLTRERAILGTVGWMSPEQAEGKPLDARSDIFSFGVVMYEMLTGRQPFRRSTTMETLAAIREEDPKPPTRLVPALPPEAERAVLRCLRKDPAKRWQSVSDLGAVLEDLREDTESGRKIVADDSPRRRSASFPVATGLVFAAVVAALATVVLVRRQPPDLPLLEMRRLTYDAGASTGPAISPDGNLVVFASDRDSDGSSDLWVRHINQPEPTRLTRHPADDSQPKFSPDGSQIVFRSLRDGGGIYVINALGGGLRKVAGRGLFPRFTPDGKSIVYVEDPNWAPGGLRHMFAVPSNGGTPEPFVPGWGVIRPPAAVGPIFSPDGSLVLFPGARFAPPSSVDWWVAPLDGSEPWSSKFLDGVSGVDVVEFPVIWLPGRLLYLSGSTIEGINLRSANITSDGSMSGPSRALTAGPGMTWQPTISNEGQILLSRFSWVVHLWEATLNPETGQPVELPRRITGDTSPKFGFSLTHNGDVLAYSTYAGSPGERRTEIHLRSRSDGEESVPISLGEQNINLFPRLNSDGSLLAWRSFRGGGATALVTPTLNPSSRVVCEGATVVDFFADGQHLLVDWGRRLSRMDIETGEDATIFELEERALLDSDLSSDDLWIAIQVGEPDGSVTIQAVPLGGLSTSPDGWIEIARGEPWVGAPRWSADGQMLYYLADRDDFTCVWGQRLDRSTKAPIGEPFAVVHAHSSRMRMLPFHRRVWSLAVGGDRLVFNAGETEGDVYTAMLE